MFEKPLETENKKIMNYKLTELENYLNSDVFVYFGSLLSNADNLVKQIIEDLKNDTNTKDVLHVILTTNGGSVAPVERIVNVFRHFYKEVNFIVPDHAYSAGTIMCMSADKIFMNYYSVLGPIDPQVQNKDGHLVPALNYLDKINEMLEKARNGTLTDAEFVILKDFDLAELREYEQQRDLAISLLEKWLVQYKFKSWNEHKDGRQVSKKEKAERARQIAKTLSDNNRWKSHGRPITMDVLSNELKLKIEDYGTDSTLKSLIDEYYKHMEEYINQHKYGMFFHTRRFI